MISPDTRAGLRLSALAATVVPAVILTAFLVRGGSGPIHRFDREVVTDWRGASDRHDWLHDLAWVLTHVGAPLVAEVVVVVAAIALLRQQRPRLALFMLVAVLGAQLVSFAAKPVIQRERPCLLEVSPCPGTFSFPSGHALVAAAAWLTLAFMVRPSRRRTAMALAVLVPLVVAATRVLLGVHYPSDVLAGLALGWAWVVGCAHVFKMWRQEEAGELTAGRRY